MSVVGELELIITARLERLTQGVAEGKKQTKDLADTGQKEMEKFQKATASAMAAIGSSIGAAFVTDRVINFGKSAIQAAASMDSLKRGLVAVSGGAAAANAELLQLKEVAKLPGLGMKEAIQGSINLQAAGFSAKVARESLKAFGNALATVGKGKAELDGVITALSQIASKGKVSAEEINQIAERVPQIRQVMKDAFGTADTEFLQKAGLKAEVFVEKVTKALKKLPPVTGGVQNDLENAADQVEQSMAEAGMAIVPLQKAFLDRAVPALKSATEWFTKLSPAAKNWTVVGTAVVAAAIPVGIAIANIAKAIQSVIALKAAYAAAAAARVAADNATAVSATRSAVAVGLARAALIGLIALAAVPIIITVKAVYDFKDAADQAAKAGADAASYAFGPRDYIRMRRNQGSKATNDQLFDEFKKSRFYQDFMKSGPNGAAREQREREGEKRDAARKAAEAAEAKERARFLEELKKAYDTNTAPKGKKAKDPSKIGAEDVELTEGILERMAKGVKTPKGLASCAYFATEILRLTGVSIGKQGAARLVDDQVLKAGGQEIKRSQAKPGDLVQFYGKGYGAWKDGKGKGYHVGIMTGADEYMDSSGGVKRFDKKNGLENARFFRPKRGGSWGDAAEAIGAVVDDAKIKAVEHYGQVIQMVTGQIASLRGVTEAQALADVLKNKGVHEGAVAYAKLAVNLMKQRDALAAKAEVERKLKEAEGSEARRAGIENAKTERDKVAWDLFGKSFDSLTDKRNRERVAAIASSREKSLEKEKVDTLRQSLEDQISSMERELAMKTRLSQVDQTRYDLEKRRAKGENVDDKQAQRLLAAAYAMDWYDAAQKRQDKNRESAEKRSQELKEKKAKEDQRAEAALDRYNDYMKDLAQRLAQSKGPAEVLRLKTDQLTEAFGGGAAGAEKARRAIEETFKVERLEEFQRQMERITEKITDALTDMADGLLQNVFRGAWDNILSGFQDMLTKMVQEWAIAQARMGIQRAVMGLASSILGGGGKGGGVDNGPGAGGNPTPMLAIGGPALKGRAHIVGEFGPEVFVPEGNGRVLTNAQSKDVLGGGGNTYIFNIHAADAPGVIKSKHQIAQELAGAAAMAARRR